MPSYWQQSFLTESVHTHWQHAQQLIPIRHLKSASIVLFQAPKLASRGSCSEGSGAGNRDEAFEWVVPPALQSTMDWIFLLNALHYSEKKRQQKGKRKGKGKRKAYQLAQTSAFVLNVLSTDGKPREAVQRFLRQAISPPLDMFIFLLCTK